MLGEKMIRKINYLFGAFLLLLTVSCSVDPEPEPISPEVPVTEQFASNMTGNYSSIADTLSVNGVKYSLAAGQGIRLTSEDLAITLKTTDGTALPFVLDTVISATEATYTYDGTSVTVTLDANKNILIDGVIVVNHVSDTIANTFAANVQGGYVTTAGTSSRTVGFALDEHTHSPIAEDLHITLIKADGTPAKLLYTQAIDASNAIYLLEGTTRSTENDLPVKILRNGHLSVNGTELLRKIQDNAPEFNTNISKIFISKDVEVTLGSQTFNIIQHQVLEIDLNNKIVLKTIENKDLTLTFDRAVNANEGIFDYTHNGVTDKENIYIVDDSILELEGVEIANLPNPAAENSFKNNIVFSSYATLDATVSRWGETFYFVKGNVFDITEESLDLKLRDNTGNNIIWEYAFAFSETKAVYSYNGNYTVISIDKTQRKISVIPNNLQTPVILAENATLYYEELFVADLIANELTMIKPSFMDNNVKYDLPILPFKPMGKEFSIIDKNNETLTATFVEIIDANSAVYTIKTKTGTVNNVTVRYENGDLFVNDQIVATQTSKLLPIERNFMGRYYLNNYETESTPGTHAYINDDNTLEIYIDYNAVATGNEMIFRLDAKTTDTTGKFKYRIIYEGNPVRSQQRYPQEIKDFIAQVSRNLDTRESPPTSEPPELEINMTYINPSIHIENRETPLITKIPVQP